MFTHTLYLKGPFGRINRKYVPSYSNRRKKSYMRLSQEWNDRFGYMMLQMSAQKKELIEYPIDLYITIVVHPRTDSDAIIKGLFDSMEESGLIKNDNLIRDFLIIRGEYSGEEMAVVKITEAGNLIMDFIHDAQEEAGGMDENS